MPIFPPSWVNEAEIASGVKKAEAALAPDVLRIRYSLADDWTGDPSIFYRVVLSDEVASREEELGETTKRIMEAVWNEVDAGQFGRHDYFNFRSQSEQAELKDPKWE
jgi:hypothetical protein